MSMTPEQQQAIIAKESAWLDADRFAPLDLSGFPALQQPPPETSRDDGRFAREYGDTALRRSASDLRRFIENPDNETLERVGRETGHEDFRDELRQRRGESVAAEFKRQCPGYVASDDNYRAITTTLAFNALPASQQNGSLDEIVADLIDGGFWTVANLTACFKALTKEGLLQVALGQPRNLSERERLYVMRLAQSGDAQEAINQYLRYSLEDDSPSIDLLTDPAYRGALDTAVMFVFETATMDYTPSEERRSFLLRYAAGRPLTLTMLNQAWQTLKAREADYARNEILDSFQRPQETPPPTAKQIDAMDDASLDRLYHDSLKAYAQSIRGAGILA